jgi:putative flippase GtrA
MKALAPRAKVVAGGLGGALGVIVVWLLTTYGNVEVPAEVAAAIATIFSIVLGYITPEAPE